MDLHDFRREYTAGGLRRSDLAHSPFDQFQRWMDEAITAGLSDPTAMVLATAGQGQQPSQRIVLLKQMDERGFAFFTGTQSDKAIAMQTNPLVSLHFPWHAIDRQVSISGLVAPLSRAESEAYFARRPRESQLAALSSAQSQPLASRRELVDRFHANAARYTESVPMPTHWGGYRVRPESMEFWQGGEYRLHDRFIYRRHAEAWQIQRLSP